MNSFDDFIPTLTVFLALISGISILFFLILYAHRPIKIIKLGTRFIVSSISGLVLWAILCFFLLEETNLVDIVPEIVTGAFLFLTIVLATWFIWSLLAFSFRFNILLTLEKMNRKTKIDDLILEYSNGQGLQPVMKGRLALLNNLNMIELIGNDVSLTSKNGRIITFWMEIIMKFWGFEKSI
jgi:hypothetical protein